ncbi:serine hydrolase [candidate division KSB1 bacterium]
MKKVLTILILVFFFPLINCKNNQANGPENKDTVCRISFPSNNSVFPKGENIKISVDISIEKFEVRYVKFLIDEEIRLWDSESPYFFYWNTSDENYGTHVIKTITMFEDGTFSEDEISLVLEYSYKIPENTGDGWEISSLNAVGIDTVRIHDMINKIITDYEFTNSVLIVRNGKLVLEEYFNDYNINKANDIASATKSVTSLLIGIAVEKGFIQSIDQKMMDFFPEYDTDSLDPRKIDITIRHLLKMKSGYPFDDHEDFNYRFWRTGNELKFTVEFPLTSTPGDVYTYSSPSTHILSAIITKATGQNALNFGNDYLFEPLNITVDWWPEDSLGNNIGGGGLGMTPREMARLGMLILNEGYYNGFQIVSSDWIKESLERYSSNVDWFQQYFTNFGYGYLWWMAQTGGHNIYFAAGHGGQHILTIPDLNMIIITTANIIVPDDKLGSQVNAMYYLISNYIVPAIGN